MGIDLYGGDHVTDLNVHVAYVSILYYTNTVIFSDKTIDTIYALHE